MASSWRTRLLCVSEALAEMRSVKSISRCQSSLALSNWAWSCNFLAGAWSKAAGTGGVNLRQQVVGVDVLAFGEGDLDQLAIHPRFDRHDLGASTVPKPSRYVDTSFCVTFPGVMGTERSPRLTGLAAALAVLARQR